MVTIGPEMDGVRLFFLCWDFATVFLLLSVSFVCQLRDTMICIDV